MKVEELRSAMAQGVVTFSFRKIDGTVRIARGTLLDSLIEQKSKGTGRTPSPEVCVYWDMDKKAWRSFKKSNLL